MAVLCGSFYRSAKDLHLLGSFLLVFSLLLSRTARVCFESQLLRLLFLLLCTHSGRVAFAFLPLHGSLCPWFCFRRVMVCIRTSSCYPHSFFHLPTGCVGSRHCLCMLRLCGNALEAGHEEPVDVILIGVHTHTRVTCEVNHTRYCRETRRGRGGSSSKMVGEVRALVR